MNHTRKLKPFVIPMLYSIAFVAFLTSLFFLREALNNPVFEDEDDDYVYVSKTIFDDVVPVVGGDKNIIRPYTDDAVKAVKYFYDKDADTGKQQNSIVFYENTYMQNSGVDYSGKQNFDVVAILDGTVINVNEDNLLGKTVQVRHSNDFISVYQSLSTITVKQGDTVTQGQVLGKSGTCNVGASLNDHLHFEILFSGKVIDPESIYDKTIKDL